MFIMADKYEPMSDEARMAAKLGLESATAELDGLDVVPEHLVHPRTSYEPERRGMALGSAPRRRDSVGQSGAGSGLQVRLCRLHSRAHGGCDGRPRHQGPQEGGRVAHQHHRVRLEHAAGDAQTSSAGCSGAADSLKEPVKAMFGHAAEYGEWPMVNSSGVQDQIAEARAEGLVV